MDAQLEEANVEHGLAREGLDKLQGPLRPGHEIRERSTRARIILTNYVGNLDSWRFRMAPGSHHGDLTRDALIPAAMLRQFFDRVED